MANLISGLAILALLALLASVALLKKERADAYGIFVPPEMSLWRWLRVRRRVMR